MSDTEFIVAILKVGAIRDDDDREIVATAVAEDLRTAGWMPIAVSVHDASWEPA